MPAIIVKFKPHYNRSLPNWNSPQGRWVGSQAQYDREMQAGGFVSYDKMMQKVEENRNKEKDYKPSEKALHVMRKAMSRADKKGNVRLDGETITKMVEMKAVKAKVPSYMQLPAKYSGKGDFYGK